jgi:hypothetical protein
MLRRFADRKVEFHAEQARNRGTEINCHLMLSVCSLRHRRDQRHRVESGIEPGVRLPDFRVG